MGTSGTTVRTADDLPPATAIPAHPPSAAAARMTTRVSARTAVGIWGDLTVGGYPPVCGAPDNSIILIGKTTQQL